MFARMARRTGTGPYQEYYSRHPELRRVDDRMRGLSPLGEPGGRFYDPDISPRANRYFRDIESIRPTETDVDQLSDRLRQSHNPNATVKEILGTLGAVASGCTKLQKSFVYTHKGRHDDDYGAVVVLNHPTIILFLVEMDFAEMQLAPHAETLRESARQYFRAATISETLSAVLQACGYDAKSHHDAHYDMMLPGLAVRAGLGELGRNNILIADRFGSRVRIGAVSTTMPMKHDSPVDLGADHFCEVCKKCAQSCPAHALSLDPKVDIRGVRKWQTNAERCYSYWRSAGTDCGVCMAVCPFSHRNTWFHSFVRLAVQRLPWSHRVALFFDNLVYGSAWSESTE